MVNLTILPLGSYGILIRMEWLEGHTEIVHYLDKVITCTKKNKETHIIKGKPRPISMCHISSLQTKDIRKKCQIFTIKVEYHSKDKLSKSLYDLEVIKKYQDVFLDEIPN